MRPYRVGLTGGLGSGKSTVAALLADAGCAVFDADRIVARLYCAGQPGAAAVRELFGAELLDADGSVNHVRLAQRVFTDAEARRRLEAAIHPLVRRDFADAVARLGNTTEVVVLEATLLVEAGYAPDFDLVVAVEADPQIRLARAVARGMQPAEARARLTAQGDGATRRAAARRLLRNDGSLDDLRTAVAGLVAELRHNAALANRPRPGA